MRKIRDFDAEMQALSERAKQLKARKVQQLGELVIVTAADALSPEELAGALLAAVATTDTATKEGWRKKGAAFFQRAARPGSGGPGKNASSAQTNGGGKEPAAGDTGAA